MPLDLSVFEVFYLDICVNEVLKSEQRSSRFNLLCIFEYFSCAFESYHIKDTCRTFFKGVKTQIIRVSMTLCTRKSSLKIGYLPTY